VRNGTREFHEDIEVRTRGEKRNTRVSQKCVRTRNKERPQFFKDEKINPHGKSTRNLLRESVKGKTKIGIIRTVLFERV